MKSDSVSTRRELRKKIENLDHRLDVIVKLASVQNTENARQRYRALGDNPDIQYLKERYDGIKVLFERRQENPLNLDIAWSIEEELRYCEEKLAQWQKDKEAFRHSILEGIKYLKSASKKLKKRNSAPEEIDYYIDRAYKHYTACSDISNLQNSPWLKHEAQFLKNAKVANGKGLEQFFPDGHTIFYSPASKFMWSLLEGINKLKRPPVIQRESVQAIQSYWNRFYQDNEDKTIEMELDHNPKNFKGGSAGRFVLYGTWSNPHTGEPEKIAVKVFPIGYERKRFESEAHRLSEACKKGIDGIVPCYNFAYEPVPNLLMARIEGKTLREMMDGNDRRGGLEARKMGELILRSGMTLHNLHKSGLTYGDLSLRNLLVAYQWKGELEKPFLADFGFVVISTNPSIDISHGPADNLVPEMTSDTEPGRRLRYLAERKLDNSLEEKQELANRLMAKDLTMLVQILYESIAGVHPLISAGGSMNENVRKADYQCTPLSHLLINELCLTLNREDLEFVKQIDSMILRCLAHDPMKRPALGEFLDELRKALYPAVPAQ